VSVDFSRCAKYGTTKRDGWGAFLRCGKQAKRLILLAGSAL
jgi:hypothetical protein